MTTAYFFDGRSARRHEVALGVGDGAITLVGAIDRRYACGDTRVAEPFEGTPTVLYFPDGARCEVDEPEAGRMLRAALGYRASRTVRLTAHTWAVLAALVLLVALILVTTFWGIPTAARKIADELPPSVDRSLGESAVDALRASGALRPSRLSDEWLAEVQQLMRRVAPADVPVRLLIHDVKAFGANAIALPDGSIIMSDLMVRLVVGKRGTIGDTEAAQLAGVLAHEIGHVRLRHGTRVLAGSSLAAALSASLLGDFSGVAALPGVLASLSYSREMEAEADEYAIALLRKNGISTLPLADLFERMEYGPELEESGKEAPGWIWEAAESFMSSHPLSEERAERLREAAGE
ncbi:M48 family metallopeptidase [Massilia sp.]|uniref:M48 family metallopeptidase n=1 Tax=Massilia sp. TaxID=1882437 RepID=UPI00289EC9E1|nr:M48 family metallopeptidase [Massilia sp.]